ncbi:MAG: hypothetical protein AB7G28_03950 [Pirellulales bacterium]
MAVGASEAAKFQPPLYLDAISWADALTILVISAGIVFVCAYVLNLMYQGKRRLPPDGPADPNR